MLSQWSTKLMNNYGVPAISLVQGSGAIVHDDQGREYIDMLAGIAVNTLGHAHPAIVDAVSTQLSQLGHVSNLFASQPVLDVANELIMRFARGKEELAQNTRVYFCNSGAEANEAAFKIARLTGRKRILAAVDGFHGRTMGALALTGQPGKREPFAPLPTGVEYYPLNDLEYLQKLVAVNPHNTAAIIFEPIQGETGVIPATNEFLQGVRELCSAHGILMILDEVQTGVGRTGEFFAHYQAGVIPDVVTMAKGLAGGLPIGACIAHGQAAELLTPGTHGTTFGGNPVVCAAAKAVLNILDDEFYAEVRTKGEYLISLLEELRAVREVRGRGLMFGVVLQQPIAKQVVAYGLEHGVILNAPSENVLRLTPPLTISKEQLRESVSRITLAIKESEGSNT